MSDAAKWTKKRLKKQRDFSTQFPAPLADMVHTGTLVVAPLAKRAQTMFVSCTRDAFGPTGSGTAVTGRGSSSSPTSTPQAAPRARR